MGGREEREGERGTNQVWGGGREAEGRENE